MRCREGYSRSPRASSWSGNRSNTITAARQSGSDSEEQRRLFSLVLSQAQGSGSAWGEAVWGRNNRREEMGQRGEEVNLSRDGGEALNV